MKISAKQQNIKVLSLLPDSFAYAISCLFPIMLYLHNIFGIFLLLFCFDKKKYHKQTKGKKHANVVYGAKLLYLNRMVILYIKYLYLFNIEAFTVDKCLWFFFILFSDSFFHFISDNVFFFFLKKGWVVFMNKNKDENCKHQRTSVVVTCYNNENFWCEKMYIYLIKFPYW